MHAGCHVAHWPHGRCLLSLHVPARITRQAEFLLKLCARAVYLTLVCQSLGAMEGLVIVGMGMDSD